MLYTKGDKFLYKDKECVIVYINGLKAWIATSDDPYVTIASIDNKGKDKEGNKAVCINNTNCLAV